MEWLKRIFRRMYGSYFFADVSLFFLRRCFFRLPLSLFDSGENLALHHPHAVYPVHALIVPKRRVYAPYNFEARELEIALRDGLRAARMLPMDDYREAMVWLNGGRFQTFSQSHVHVYPRKTPVEFSILHERRMDGFTLTECTRYSGKETDLLIFRADEDLFGRFVDAFYHDILPAYDLESRGYSIYVFSPLPADPAREIDALFIRIGAYPQPQSMK